MYATETKCVIWLSIYRIDHQSVPCHAIMVVVIRLFCLSKRMNRTTVEEAPISIVIVILLLIPFFQCFISVIAHLLGAFHFSLLRCQLCFMSVSAGMSCGIPNTGRISGQFRCENSVKDIRKNEWTDEVKGGKNWEKRITQLQCRTDREPIIIVSKLSHTHNIHSNDSLNDNKMN